MTADIVQELNDEARACINLADGAQNAIVNERENRLAMQFSRAAAEIVRLRWEVAAMETVAPFLWLRMRPDGTPDWAEDCVGKDEHFLDSELKRDGYWLKPLYGTTPPAAQVQVQQEAVDRDAWEAALELPEGYEVAEFLPGIWQYEWDRHDGELMASGASWNHPALAAIAAWQAAYDATPPAAGDKVRELVNDWRESAAGAKRYSTTDYEDGYAAAEINCANRLEAILAQPQEGSR